MKKQITVILALFLSVTLFLSSCGTSDIITISGDGYWVIFGEKTDTRAVAQDGKDGEDGKDGIDGKNGKDGEDGADAQTMDIKELGYVIVSEYVKNDGSENVSDGIQALIDNNPNRTLYFSDGVYLLDKPLLTSANPSKSVHLLLSNYAVLRASNDWQGGSLVNFGGAEKYNNVTSCGSNYGIDGGILDGNHLANGVEISSGRETRIRNLSMKNCLYGIYIHDGANSTSSDADIMDCTIIGSDVTQTSVGICLNKANDNTFTNIRIGHCQVGVLLQSSSGNVLRNVHPLFCMAHDDYQSSIGFWDETGSNTFDYCYADQFATAFKVKGVSCFTDCWAFWYTANDPIINSETIFDAPNGFQSVVTRLHVGFCKEPSGSSKVVPRTVVNDHGKGGSGILRDTVGSLSKATDNTHIQYLVDSDG